MLINSVLEHTGIVVVQQTYSTNNYRYIYSDNALTDISGEPLT